MDFAFYASEDRGLGDAVDLLEALPEEIANDIRKHMEKQDREEMEELLQYHPETAGGLMSPDFMSLDGEQTAGEAITSIQKRSEEKEMVFYLYITHGDGKLAGPESYVVSTAIIDGRECGLILGADPSRTTTWFSMRTPPQSAI